MISAQQAAFEMFATGVPYELNKNLQNKYLSLACTMQVLHTFSKSGQIQTVCLRNGSPEILVYSAEHVFLLSQYDSQCLQYT